MNESTHHSSPKSDARRVFLDHAAVATISQPAAEALVAYAQQAAEEGYAGQNWYRRVKAVRQAIAGLIGASGPEAIAFVPNTSTGLATVAEALPFEPGDEVLITNVEYPANRYPWEHLGRKGVELVEVAQQPDGRIPAESVIAAISPKTKLVALSMVQYASGYRMDLKPIADAVHAVGGFLCVDGIQSVGAMPVDVDAIGADFLAADGHKWLLGPEGAGFLYVRPELIPQMTPPVVGWLNMVDATNYGSYQYKFWPDARRFEPGTWNIPGILALGASVDHLLQTGIDQVWATIQARVQQAADGIEAMGGTILSPRGVNETSGLLCFLPPMAGGDPSANGTAETAETPAALTNQLRRIQAKLLDANITVAVREGKLRISPHVHTTSDDMDHFLASLAAICQPQNT